MRRVRSRSCCISLSVRSHRQPLRSIGRRRTARHRRRPDDSRVGYLRFANHRHLPRHGTARRHPVMLGRRQQTCRTVGRRRATSRSGVRRLRKRLSRSGRRGQNLVCRRRLGRRPQRVGPCASASKTSDASHGRPRPTCSLAHRRQGPLHRGGGRPSHRYSRPRHLHRSQGRPRVRAHPRHRRRPSQNGGCGRSRPARCAAPGHRPLRPSSPRRLAFVAGALEDEIVLA
jgi:hypothetical protein